MLPAYSTPNSGVIEVSITSNAVSYDQLSKLFDLIPNFEYCNFDQTSGRCRIYDALLKTSSLLQ